MKLLNRRNLMLAASIGFAAALTAGALISGSANAAVETGAAAPAFSVRDASGATRSLSEFAGRTVVIEWTNKDCPYVRKHYSSGNMQDLQGAATDQGVVWLTVISSAPGEQGYLTGAAAAAQRSGHVAAMTGEVADEVGDDDALTEAPLPRLAYEDVAVAPDEDRLQRKVGRHALHDRQAGACRGAVAVGCDLDQDVAHQVAGAGDAVVERDVREQRANRVLALGELTDDAPAAIPEQRGAAVEVAAVDAVAVLGHQREDLLLRSPRRGDCYGSVAGRPAAQSATEPRAARIPRPHRFGYRPDELVVGQRG